MIRKNKNIITIISIINFLSLFIFSLKDDLLTSNLSRIANKTKSDYLLFLFISFIFGLMLFITFSRLKLKKESILGLISLLIGGIVPYNYLDTTALSSNLHLIGGFLSIISLLICLITIIKHLNFINIKYANFLKAGLIITCLIFVYLYGRFGFVNSLSELFYLYLIIISVNF